jgi:hypothetical protein
LNVGYPNEEEFIEEAVELETTKDSDGTSTPTVQRFKTLKGVSKSIQ